MAIPEFIPESEGRFTWATELCPHPERWHSTDGDSTEVEVSEFMYGLTRALQPDEVLETGAGFGQTTEQIGKALKANGHGRLHSMETDPERTPVVRERCAGLPVGVYEMSSLDFLPPGKLQLCFFDSWYELRVPEFRRFYPFMDKGSIVVFHDTAPEHGSHRIESGNDLQTEIEKQLEGLVRTVRFPTPRGVTIGEVLK